MLKKRLDAIFTTLSEEKAAWEARRESMREGFMRELEGGGATDAVEIKKEAAAAPRGSSDEDAVIVEKGGEAAASSVGGGGGGGGKSKKKKGKK